MSKEPTIPAQTVNDMPERPTADGAATSPAASEPRRLRRWSVAELLALAVARPPSTA
jgi:hypothetical protein